jgi:hypothetical protein
MSRVALSHVNHNTSDTFRYFVIDPAKYDLADCIQRPECNDVAVWYLTQPLDASERRELRDIGCSIQDGKYTTTLFRPDGTSLVRLIPVDLWFGRDVSEDVADTAFSLLDEYMAKALNQDVSDARRFRLRYTPAQTGVALMQHLFPHNHSFSLLAPDIQRIIRSVPPDTVPQHREEIYMPKRRVSSLYYYDVRADYESLLMNDAWPTGEAKWILSDEYIKYDPAWYHIVGRVPLDWQHIGLVWQDGKWVSKPGQSFDAWVCEPEMRVLYEQAWDIKIRERIEFDAKNGRNVLEKFTKALQSVQDGLNHPAINTACRNMRYHAIGSLHSTGVIEKVIPFADFDETEYPGDIYELTVNKNADYVVKYRPGKGPAFGYGVEAPQLSAYIWSKSRARMSRALLSVDRADLVATYADGLYTIKPYSFPPSKNKRNIGHLRLKASIERPVKVPAYMSDFKMDTL